MEVFPGNEENEIKSVINLAPYGHSDNKRLDTIPSVLKLKKTVASSDVQNIRIVTSFMSPKCQFIANKNSELERRNSLKEIKKLQGHNIKLKRSSSLGKESGIMSTLSKIRENILKSPYYQSKKEDIFKENVKTSEEKVLSFKNK